MTNRIGTAAFQRLFNAGALFSVLFPLLVFSFSRLTHHDNYYYGQRHLVQRYLEEAVDDYVADYVDDGVDEDDANMDKDDLYWYNDGYQENEENEENEQDWEENEEYRNEGKNYNKGNKKDDTADTYKYGRQNADNYAAPVWWMGTGRSLYPEQEIRVGIILSYIYILLVFAGLTRYGNFVIRRETTFETLQAALLMFSNLAVAVMFLVAGTGIVETEQQELQATGWYGQLSVCIYLTCFFWFFHGLVWSWMLVDRWGSETPCIVRPEDDTTGKYFEYR